MPELRTLPSGWHLERHVTISSTNDRAGAWAREGRPLPAVVLAETQTEGRGQRGRSWSSPRGAGLYASFVIQPDVPPAQSPLLTLLAGLALLDAIGPPLAGRLALKWPNDVWVGSGARAGAKVAGILVEGAISETRLEHVVVGVGLNLTPAPREGDAVSLAELGAAEGRSLEAWCDGICEALDRRSKAFEVEGLGPLEAEWTARAFGVGRKIRWGDGRRTLQGSLLGIREGGLLVRTEAGPDEVLHHGRIEAFL